MAAVTVSTKGDHNTCMQGLNKGSGYAVAHKIMCISVCVCVCVCVSKRGKKLSGLKLAQAK